MWDAADTVVGTWLLYVESAAALAQATRMARLTEDEHAEAVRILGRLWAETDVVEVDQGIVSRAADLAYTCSLRGYDAVHCASAEQLHDEESLVVVAGDGRLLEACETLGMATADVNEP